MAYQYTKTETQIMSLMENFRVVKDEQLRAILLRNGKSSGKVQASIRDLYMMGHLFYQKEESLWKTYKNAQPNWRLIDCLWIMMECTKNSQEEMMAYTEFCVVSEHNPCVKFILNGCFYYVFYFQNKAEAFSLPILEDKIAERGSKASKQSIRCLFISEDREVLEGIAPQFNYAKILLKRTIGHDKPEYEYVND